ncbi:uncharacterized protein LOC130216575 [Danio aesculapii]|uniref:uncharacterized protein LOC130216575 n=1 Tax=Danio aesculapii TaxID=1142201 RepID=UPI0024BF9CD1|nr:uncharacterized protein LOC130216575 [Danio aesculapii]
MRLIRAGQEEALHLRTTKTNALAGDKPNSFPQNQTTDMSLSDSVELPMSHLSVFGESISVTEADSATLHTGVTEIQDNDDIVWKLGADNSVIAEISRDKQTDNIYRDRLKLDDQTGSLTITNTTTEDAGDYKLEINGVKLTIIIFRVSVYARLPVPVLIFNSSQCSSSSSSSVQYCSVLCSVVNVSAVSLSWYKGNSVLSSINVSDLSISLSLPLEVEYQDKNTYSCVINNTISNQTTYLDINTLSQLYEESVLCCGPTEAVTRLVVSALVGVAMVAFLVYDIRSTRGDKQQTSEML